MAGKRSASNDLNHDNWDRDDDVEDAGTFQKAADDVLKRRVIKTAKRRNPVTAGNGEEGTNKPVFGGFTGFASFAPPNPNAAFSFLNNSNTIAKPSTPASFTSAKLSLPSQSTGLTNGVVSKSEKKKDNIFNMDKKEKKSDDDKHDNDDSSEDRSEYYAKLKGLNESVLSWIEKHVKENPFINLKPIFTDYERYLTDLEVKHVTVSADTKKELVGFAFKSSPQNDANKSPPMSAFSSSKTTSFGSTTDKTDKKKEDKMDKAGPFGSSNIFGKSGASSTEKFSFGMPSSTVAGTTGASTEKASSFVFGSANAAKTAPTADVSKPFAFGGGSTGLASTPGSLFGGSKPTSTPFSFGSSVPTFASTPAPQSETINLDEDEDEPPKVEFTPVVEQDHIYTIRCKVFVKKDGNFGDRGVGNLYLKKVPESEKVQLIVRADTNLGNLLCNLILSEAVPTQRMGKKDVMLVCIPLPDEKPPPVPMLLRVKNEAEADALLKVLEKHKK